MYTYVYIHTPSFFDSGICPLVFCCLYGCRKCCLLFCVHTGFSHGGHLHPEWGARTSKSNSNSSRFTRLLISLFPVSSCFVLFVLVITCSLSLLFALSSLPHTILKHTNPRFFPYRCLRNKCPSHPCRSQGQPPAPQISMLSRAPCGSAPGCEKHVPFCAVRLATCLNIEIRGWGVMISCTSGRALLGTFISQTPECDSDGFSIVGPSEFALRRCETQGFAQAQFAVRFGSEVPTFGL